MLASIAADVADVAWPSAEPPAAEVQPGRMALRIAGRPDIPGGEWLVTLHAIGCAPASVRLGESFTTPRRKGLGAAIWRSLCHLLPRHGIDSLIVEADEMGRTFWARRELRTRFDPSRSVEHGRSFAAWFGRGTLPHERKGVVVGQILPDVPISRLDRLVAEGRHEELGRLLAATSVPSDWEPHVGTWIERDNWHGIVDLDEPVPLPHEHSRA